MVQAQYKGKVGHLFFVRPYPICRHRRYQAPNPQLKMSPTFGAALAPNNHFGCSAFNTTHLLGYLDEFPERGISESGRVTPTKKLGRFKHARLFFWGGDYRTAHFWVN